MYIFGYKIELFKILPIIQNVNEYSYPRYSLDFYASYNVKIQPSNICRI